MNFSVDKETSGYEAMIEGEKGDRRRMGRFRRDDKKRVEAGFWSSYEG